MTQLSSRLSRNTIALLISNGGSALLSFGLSVIIGRLLNQDGLGTYVTVLAWIFPMSLIAEFGIGTLITRDIAQSPQQSHAYLRASVQARLLIGGGITGIFWMILPLLTDVPAVIQGMRISIPLIIVLPLYSSFTAIFRARQQMIPIALLNLGMLIAQVSLTFIVLSSSGSIRDVFIINTCTSAGQLIAAWGIYRWHFFTPADQSIAVLQLLRPAVPFAIAAVLAAVQMRLTIILLEQFTSTSAVGTYAAASRFIEAGRLLPHAFFDALFPLLAGLAAQPARLKRTFTRVMLVLIAYGVVFGVIIQVIRLPLLTLTYGADFRSAAPILSLLGWSLLPMLLKSGRTLYWYARGYESFVNWTTAGVIVIQVALAWMIIPLYGSSGAALVSLSAEVIAFALLWFRQPKNASTD